VLHTGLGNYNNVAVEWVHGATPTAFFYDEAGTEIEQVVLGDRDHSELMTLFAEHHFKPVINTAIYGEPLAVREYGGHTYKFYNIENPKDFAAEFAGSLNGYLATVTNQQEQNFLASVLEELKISRAWLGASDSEEEGTWKWTHGPEKAGVFWSSTPEKNVGGYYLWFHGEPNDIDSEDCAVLLPDGWNDVRCATERAALVVEFGEQPVEEVPFPRQSASTPSESVTAEEPKSDL